MRGARERAAAVRARRQALSARLRERRRPDRRPWLLLALVLALLLLAAVCCCGPPPVAPPPPEPAPAPAPVGPAAAPPPPGAPLPGGRVSPRPRPAFAPPPAEELPWLPAFRLQVSARGPRLAACFAGVERPGTLRWTTQVEPESGRVSDHALEPTLSSDPLTPGQRRCVLDVLADPPYAIDAPDGAPPARVSVAIGF